MYFKFPKFYYGGSNFKKMMDIMIYAFLILVFFLKNICTYIKFSTLISKDILQKFIERLLDCKLIIILLLNSHKILMNILRFINYSPFNSIKI